MGANLLPSDDLGSNLGSATFNWKEVFTELLNNGTDQISVADLVNIISSQYRTDVANPAHSEGLVFYDNTKKAISYYNDNPDTSVSLGQELLVKVYNNTAALITNGQVISTAGGSVGVIPTVELAQADTVVNSGVLGVATHDIQIGSSGYATIWGTISGYDTSLFTEGDLLYLSADTAGALTNAEQPILRVVGIVLDSDVNGSILVGQRPLTNVTTIGQATGYARTQDLTTTPQPLTAYEATIFELHTTVTQTGTDNLTASISPTTSGVSGYYRVSFNTSVQSAQNELIIFEAYHNGDPSGILCAVDLRNNNIDAGSASFSAISQTIILETDNIEIYAYTDGGAATVALSSTAFNIERIGTA